MNEQQNVSKQETDQLPSKRVKRSMSSQLEERLNELHESYYGYAVNRKHHYGRVMRVIGRGGRVRLERLAESRENQKNTN